MNIKCTYYSVYSSYTDLSPSFITLTKGSESKIFYKFPKIVFNFLINVYFYKERLHSSF